MSYLKLVLSLLFLFIIPSRAYADGKPVINEFLPHPSSGNKEWVEIYVPDGESLNGYWIDDDTDFLSDTGSSTKKEITSVEQGSDSQHIVYELSSSMFNNDGDTVALFAPDGTLLDQYSYSKDPGEDISIGRTPDATGGFQILASSTKGAPNSSPKPTDTPTPAPTEKPSPTSKPTVTPKPIKVSSPTSSVSTISSGNSSSTNQSVLADAVSDKEENALPITQISTDEAQPTSILTTKITAVPTKITPQKRILVKGITSSMPQVIAVVIGGLLFVSCGILMYLKKRGVWFWKRD